MLREMKVLPIALSVLAGCEPPPDDCLIEGVRKTATCEAALRFAMRDSETISIDPEFADRYYERWKRVAEAEPFLGTRMPQTYRNRGWRDITINVTDPQIVSAWNGGELRTGVDYMDSAVEELVSPHLEFALDRYYGIRVDAPYGEEALARALLQGGGATLNEPLIYPGDDGIWRWSDSTAEIDFMFGWGDCFVECTGYRFFRAVAPQYGEARVYDLGGDPLPPGIVLAPTTLPP